LGDKTQGMVFAGTIFQNNGTYRLGRGIDQASRIGKAMSFLTSAVKDPSILRQYNVTFQHEGKCCSCGLSLTHPSSIPVGFGPDCLKRKMQDPDFATMFKLSFPDFKY
jgi:hypothetical protein